MHVRILMRPMPDAVVPQYGRHGISPAKVRPDDQVAIRPAQRCFTTRPERSRAIVGRLCQPPPRVAFAAVTALQFPPSEKACDQNYEHRDYSAHTCEQFAMLSVEGQFPVGGHLDFAGEHALGKRAARLIA